MYICTFSYAFELHCSQFDHLFTRSHHQVDLPNPGEYATGIVFVAKSTTEQAFKQFESLASECDLKVCLSINYT